jgi:zinc transporter
MLNTIQVGIEPGLRFAVLFDKSGGCTSLDWEKISRWQPQDGFLWIHLEREDEIAQEWLRKKSGIDSVSADALLADESRPRVSDIDDALLIVLRGVNVAEGVADAELVPIHIWAEATRVISIREKEHQLSALSEIRNALMAHKGPRCAAELVAQIAERVVEHVEIIIDNLEEQLEVLEDTCYQSKFEGDWRDDLGILRRKATSLRRYIGPQRDALYRLQHDDASWITDLARQRLREVSDKIIRHLEDIEALRDRASILHDDLTARISERIAHTSNRLTGLAALLLPPSLIAGMFGMNIEGIPGKDDPLAFPLFCIIMVVLMPVLWYFLKKAKWL